MAKQHEMEIDMARLHVEWKEFPARYHDAVMKCQELTDKAERLKSKLELVKAQVEEEVRESPSTFRLTKVTDSAVDMKVKIDSRVQDAEEDYQDAKSEVGYCRAMLSALDSRKRALEYICELRMKDYWSEPNISSAARERGAEDAHARAVRKTARKDD